MPTIKNMSYGPLSIARADKDPLTLGPRETADISDTEFDSDEILRHLRDRRIAVVPEAPPDEWAPAEGAPAGGAAAEGAPVEAAPAEGGGGRPRSNERRGSGASTPTPSE
jgi:hypothetical protein